MRIFWKAQKRDFRGLSNRHPFYEYLKESGPRLLLFAIIGGILALNISSQIYQSQSQNRREDLLEKIQLKLDAAEMRLTDLQKQGLTLQNQNNELQQLSICMLQLIKGGDFTDRDECQAKVDDFEQNNGVITSSSNNTTRPNPQPNAAPTAPTSTPDPRCTVVKVLGICL